MVYVNVSFALLSLLTFTIFNKATRALEEENIQGGYKAEHSQYPYHVHIELNYGSCGGSIIHERFVATAAHCIVTPTGNFIRGTVKIVAGVNDLTVPSSSKIVRRVDKLYTHKDFRYYDGNLNIPDMAVLRLSKPLFLHNTPGISKLSLPTSWYNYVSKAVAITGFGANKVEFEKSDDEIKIIDMHYSQKLRYAKPIILDPAVCKTLIPEVSEAFICAHIHARSLMTPEGTCKGDSGGPLVYGNTLIGILYIAVDNCDEIKYPGFYINVTHYKNFFEEALKDNCRADFMKCGLVK